eukprot:355639-Alexandrium_andersonii.AAC.2
MNVNGKRTREILDMRPPSSLGICGRVLVLRIRSACPRHSSGALYFCIVSTGSSNPMSVLICRGSNCAFASPSPKASLQETTRLPWHLAS